MEEPLVHGPHGEAIMDSRTEPETVVLEPNWTNTVRWWALALAAHDFERGAYGPVLSFMEQVRHLDRTQPGELERIIQEWAAKARAQDAERQTIGVNQKG